MVVMVMAMVRGRGCYSLSLSRPCVSCARGVATAIEPRLCVHTERTPRSARRQWEKKRKRERGRKKRGGGAGKGGKSKRRREKEEEEERKRKEEEEEEEEERKRKEKKGRKKKKEEEKEKRERKEAKNKKKEERALAAAGFDPATSRLWASRASSAPSRSNSCRTCHDF